MKKLTTILFLFFTILIVAQNPWTKDKGDLFINLSYTTISDYSELFGDLDYTISGSITDQTYQIYGEYGFTNKTSLVFNIPFKSIDNNEIVNPCLVAPCPESSNEKSSFGNVSLGIKHQLYNKDWVVAAQLISEINTGSYDENTGIRTGYNAFTFTPQLLAGKSFGKTFFQSQIGFDIKTNNYSNNFKIGGEFGGKVSKNIWLIGYIDVVKSFEDGNVNLPSNNLLTGLYINNQEYGAYGLKGILQFYDIGITAGFGSAFFGNNVPKKAAFSFGIFNTF